MVRRPPRSTRTDPLFPYTTLFRSEDWLAKVELDLGRIDDKPKHFSGGMQQRLQIARNLVTKPRLVFMDEPTGGLDVSVPARLLDLLRELIADFGLAAIIVTHHLAVAPLLSHRLPGLPPRGAVEGSDERRVGQDGGLTCRFRGSPFH